MGSMPGVEQGFYVQISGMHSKRQDRGTVDEQNTNLRVLAFKQDKKLEMKQFRCNMLYM